MKLSQVEENNFEIRIDDILASLKNVKKTSTGWTARCPNHNDHRNSLSVSEAPDGKPLVHCHACKDNMSYEDFLRIIGLWQEPELNPDKFNIEAEYDYVDEHGELRYQVLRLKPKRFAQRRPDGKGGWIYDLKGVQRLIYRLPEILHTTTPVIIVEGEKDANNLVELGFNATTNSGGAGKWDKSFNKYFKGLDVIIIPDNDKYGQEHAEDVSKQVFYAANSVKIVPLDGLSEKEDFSDWIARNSSERLSELIDETPTLQYEEEDIQFDQTEPHDANAEVAILGAVFRNPTLIAKVMDAELLKDMYVPKHRHVLIAMIDCFKDKQKVDFVTVSDRLKRHNKYATIGGVDFLKSLKDNTPDTLNLENWIEIVKGKSDFRKYLKIAQKLTKVVHGELDNPVSLGDEITKDIFSIRRKEGARTFNALGDLAEDVLGAVKNLEAGQMIGLPTGFIDLDSLLAGLQPTDLIIVAARPSMGKTGFALNIATNVALNGKLVLFFSLEMNKEQLTQRVISSEAFVDSNNFRNGNLSEEDWVRMANVMPALAEANLLIDDTPAISVPQIRGRVMQLEAETGQKPDLIVVDYLQLMSGNRQAGDNRQQEVSQISRELKSLAKEMKVPVIALSQLSRAPEARNPPIPMMSDLRESGSIEQDADVVIFIYRHHYYNKADRDSKGLAQIIVAKQRNGKTDTVDMGFIDKFTKFMNLIQV